MGGQGLEGLGWVVRVNMIEDLKFLGKFTQKKIGGGGGGGGVRVRGIRVDVNEDEVFGKILKKNLGGGGWSGGGQVWGAGWWGVGVRVDVNEILGEGDYLGYGGGDQE